MKRRGGTVKVNDEYISFEMRTRRTKQDGTITYYAEFLSDEKDGTVRRKRLAMRSMRTSD